MADRPPTRAARPPAKSGGGEKQLFGMKQSTVFIVGGAALGLGLLYFYMKQKQQPQGQGQGKGQGKGKGQTPGSPTGLSREQLVIHVQDHQGHKRRPAA